MALAVESVHVNLPKAEIPLLLFSLPSEVHNPEVVTKLVFPVHCNKDPARYGRYRKELLAWRS